MFVRADGTLALSARARKTACRLLYAKGAAPFIDRKTLRLSPGAVAKLTEAELWDARNCGKKTVAEIKDWLAVYGLTLSPDGGPTYDGVTANVYADWLDENDEPKAAAKLRAAFPIDQGAEVTS